MKKRPQVIVYILLNIIISAATMLFVMWLWDRVNSEPVPLSDEISKLTAEKGTTGPGTIDSPNSNDPTPTIEFISEEFNVQIETIVGPGDLDVEYVEISNKSEGSVDMGDWQLVDEDGHNFNFPAIILNNGGDIKVLSQKGLDTVIELYWQSESPIWESGETAKLLDENGNIISTYSIP